MQTAIALDFGSAKFSRLFHIALLILQFGFLATPTESSADEKSRRACIKSSGGVVDEGVCNQIEIDKLIDKNNQLMVKIESELTSCTPTSEAYDYKKAQSNLKKSNQNWKSFAAQDCDLTANTFGVGTGAAGAYLHCRIDHLRQRNLSLTKRLKDIEATRTYLMESDTDSKSSNRFIFCKSK